LGFGESRGSNEVITNRVVNIGKAGLTNEARVADYYAHAITMLLQKTKGFTKQLG